MKRDAGRPTSQIPKCSFTILQQKQKEAKPFVYLTPPYTAKVMRGPTQK